MALITRDLLGGSFSSSTSKLVDSQELDLDFQVPNGWEKRLDVHFLIWVSLFTRKR